METFTYSPYGVAGGSSSGFPFRYTGQKLDPETGLYYYKARYYDPETGRFLQTDPIGYEDQMNLYAYVANDPLNGIDPSGMCTGSRLTNADGTCMSTGGFTTDTSDVVQAVAIDRAIGEVFTDSYSVKIANNVTSNQPNNRAVGRAFRASYNGSNRQYGFDSPTESLAAAAGRLVSETLGDGNEWHTATFQDPATGRYGFANPTTSGSREYVDALIRLPFGIAERDIEDIVHSHPGNLEEGPFGVNRNDGHKAGQWAVGARNRNMCFIRPSSYGRCKKI